jgi:MSHA biogenesis protein MshG
MYERETDYSIKGLSASIEPVLLSVIGVMVLVLALGVFLPLWNLGAAAKGGG